ncbi:MAG TPA: DUF402 domain-containing protein [Egicoccus sp.]|nr:DUF402 domain-containing protein [Egicoccus sp.]HSK25235.1 DUF402 domain-containing protein [Egicoccus sp.]
MESPAWKPGRTAVRRFLYAGRAGPTIPTRVVTDDAHGPVLAHWTGVSCRMTAGYGGPGSTRPREGRLSLLDDLAAGRFRLVEYAWSDTIMLTVLLPGEWFSVAAMFAEDDHRLLFWYVNFELPFRRTTLGFDSSDLFLDLVAGPEGGWLWKDEDEYVHAQRIGLITPEQERQIEAARERAVAMVEQGAGPMAQGWEAWRREADWPRPELPDGWDRLETSR